MGLVCANAFANYHILHRYNLVRYSQTKEQVDRILLKFPAKHHYFSLEVPHDLTAFGIGVREISDLNPIFEMQSEPLSVFRERSNDYSISVDSDLPLEYIQSGSLVLTRRYFEDSRAKLIFGNEQLELFAYYVDAP